jgi:hypothetical protein
MAIRKGDTHTATVQWAGYNYDYKITSWCLATAGQIGSNGDDFRARWYIRRTMDGWPSVCRSCVVEYSSTIVNTCTDLCYAP